MQFYVTLGACDAAAAHAFYDEVLATIGWSAHTTFGSWRGYSAKGQKDGITVWVVSHLTMNRPAAETEPW